MVVVAAPEKAAAQYMTCWAQGRLVPYIFHYGIPDIGMAGQHPVYGLPVIFMNPSVIAQVEEPTATFFAAHECGHHVLGHVHGQGSYPLADEQAADCWAIVALVRRKVFKSAEVSAVQRDLRRAPGDWQHLPGPQRAINLEECLASDFPTELPQSRATTLRELALSYGCPYLPGDRVRPNELAANNCVSREWYGRTLQACAESADRRCGFSVAEDTVLEVTLFRSSLRTSSGTAAWESDLLAISPKLNRLHANAWRDPHGKYSCVTDTTEDSVAVLQLTREGGKASEGAAVGARRLVADFGCPYFMYDRVSTEQLLGRGAFQSDEWKNFWFFGSELHLCTLQMKSSEVHSITLIHKVGPGDGQWKAWRDALGNLYGEPAQRNGALVWIDAKERISWSLIRDGSSVSLRLRTP